MNDVMLHQFMMGVSGNLQLTTIPAITSIDKVCVFPFYPLEKFIDWNKVLYSFNLDPGSSIVYDHGQWRAQSFTYNFEGTRLYRTDTLTHERQLFLEFHIEKNFDWTSENKIIQKPYCERPGRLRISQSAFSRYYKTDTLGEDYYQYGYWLCPEKGSSPELVLCQDKKFDLKLISCRSLTECETKAENYIWPDKKDLTKYFQCRGNVVIHDTCPKSNPIFNGLRCINPVCNPLMECDNDCHIPKDHFSFYTCKGMEATIVYCRQGVDSLGTNCLQTCRGSTVFVQKFLETIQVTPKKVLVEQKSCINGKIISTRCDTHLHRKIVGIGGKLYFYYAPNFYLVNNKCLAYKNTPSIDEMVIFPDSPDPAIASHRTGTGRALTKLIPYESFASFETDRTTYYDINGVQYQGVLFYFGTQKYILDNKFLTVPEDTKFVHNNNLNGVWTEQLTLTPATNNVDEISWIEDKTNDCDVGIDIPDFYYVDKTGTAMCIDGKPTLDICADHGMMIFPSGCGYSHSLILSTVGDKAKRMAKMTGKRIRGTYKGIYSTTNSLWYT